MKEEANTIYQRIKAGVKFKCGLDSLRSLKVMFGANLGTDGLLEALLRNEGVIILNEQEEGLTKGCDVYVFSGCGKTGAAGNKFPADAVIIGNDSSGDDEMLSEYMFESNTLYIPGIIGECRECDCSDIYYNVLECLHLSDEIKVPTYYAAKFMIDAKSSKKPSDPA